MSLLLPGVTSLSWSPGGQYLLVCCENGKVYEITPPSSFLVFDTSVSYEIKLSMREYLNSVTFLLFLLL